MEPGLGSLPELRESQWHPVMCIQVREERWMLLLLFNFGYFIHEYCIIPTSPSPLQLLLCHLHSIPDSWSHWEKCLTVQVQLPEFGFLRTNMGIPSTPMCTKACSSKACYDMNMGDFRSFMPDNVCILGAWMVTQMHAFPKSVWGVLSNTCLPLSLQGLGQLD